MILMQRSLFIKAYSHFPTPRSIKWLWVEVCGARIVEKQTQTLILIRLCTSVNTP